jgi:hypothetical protein
VGAEIEPQELAQLVDFAERPRNEDWSMRAALVRYAQGEPQRVSDVLDVVRRVEWALGKNSKVVEREGRELWAALSEGSAGPDPFVVGVLRAARELDHLGDALAAWAVDPRHGQRPDAKVDDVIEEVAQQLEVLGVPHEEQRPPGARNRGV